MNTTIFPGLITFWFVAPFILRVVAGFIFIYFGYTKIWKERERRISVFHTIGLGTGKISFWIVSLAELIGGIFLALGLFIQITAIILSLIITGAVYTKVRKPDLLDNSLEFFLLLLAVLASLIFLGSGFLTI